MGVLVTKAGFDLILLSAVCACIGLVLATNGKRVGRFVVLGCIGILILGTLTVMVGASMMVNP